MSEENKGITEEALEKTDKAKAVKSEKKKHGKNKNSNANGGASKAIKLCVIAAVAVILIGGIIFAVMLMRGDKSEDEFSPFDNNEEIDGKDDDFSKIY